MPGLILCQQLADVSAQVARYRIDDLILFLNAKR